MTPSHSIHIPFVSLTTPSPLSGEFKEAYPEAKLIGVEPILKKEFLAGLKFDGGSYLILFQFSLDKLI